MKKMMISMALLGSTLLMADGYVSVEQLSLHSKKKNIYSYQPMSDMIGKDVSMTKVSIGLEANKDKKSIFYGSRIGIYGGYSSDKYKDISGGVEFLLRNTNHIISPYFSGFVGVGYRNDKGARFNSTTSIGQIEYITHTDSELKQNYMNPTKGTIIKNSGWVDVGFGIGLNFNMKNVNLNIGYAFVTRSYDTFYKLDTRPDYTNTVGTNQWNSGLQVGLEIKF